jgi:hypothetical protein
MVHLFFRDSFGGSRGGGGSCLLIVRKDMRSRARGTDISLLGGPFGELGKVLVCRSLCGLWRRASPWEPCDHLGRCPFTGNSERSLKGGSGSTSVSMGAL